MGKRIAPSILSADFNTLGEQLGNLEKAGCEWLHVDVMDGMFVPSISFGQPVIKSIRKESGMFFDVHMMVEDPGRYIADMKNSGADMVTVHAESCKHLDRVLQAIRGEGMKSGVALNPATPLCALDYVLDKTDMVLIMTVNPGYGGQKYIPAMTQKIKELREKLDKAGHPEILIEIDGGVNTETAAVAAEAGVDVLVAGSAVFGGDYVKKYRELVRIANE